MFGIQVNKLMFFLSILFAFACVILAFIQPNQSNDFSLVFTNINYKAYLVALLTAMSWAIYSNMIKKYKTEDDIAALPIIFVLSGLAFLI